MIIAEDCLIMIEELWIKNFQSHKDTKIRFGKNLNVIIGSSDSGKTAILRALRWLIYGRPMGKAFQTHGTTRTMVQIILDNGVKVKRLLDGKESSYYLNGKKYAAVGREVS